MRRLVSFPLLRTAVLKFEQAGICTLPDDLQHFFSRQPDQYNDTGCQGKNRPARLLVNVLWLLRHDDDYVR